MTDTPAKTRKPNRPAAPKAAPAVKEPLAKTEAPTKSKSTSAPKNKPFAELSEIFSSKQMEIPAVLRETTEKGVEQAKANYAKFKNAAEEATDFLEGNFENTRKGVVKANLKALDAAKENTEAYFSFAKKMFSAKTFGEAVELQTSFFREQFDTFTKQTKDMQQFTQKFAEETRKPYQAAFSKTIEYVKAS